MMNSFFLPNPSLKCPSGSGFAISRASRSQLSSWCEEESMTTPSQSKIAPQMCAMGAGCVLLSYSMRLRAGSP